MCSTLSKDTIYCDSGIMLDYVETNIWVDGNPIDLPQCDGLIYITENSKYYVLTDFLAGYSLNPKIFGANGDGITDDTIAIQSMMDFAWKLRDAGIYTNIHFPRGNYKISSMVQVPHRVSISGDGINSSVIFTNLSNHDLFHFREEKNKTNSHYLLDENGDFVLTEDGEKIGITVNTLYTKISNISFYGNNQAGLINTNPIEGNTGLVFIEMVKVELDSVSLRGFLINALYFEKVYYIKLKNVNAEYNRFGLCASNCTSIESVNCEFRLNSIGIYLYDTNAFSFINPLIESNVWNLDNNAINCDVNNTLNPHEKSSIGILLLSCWGGSFLGGYFENQLVDIFYLNSKNINVENSFFCNISLDQKESQGHIPAYSVYMYNSHENVMQGNSYLMFGDSRDLRMYIHPTSHNNVIRISKKEDFDNWVTVNKSIIDEFAINNIIEKSPRVICEGSDVEYTHGRKKNISGIFYGDSTEKLINPVIGQLYFNTTNSKIEFFDGVNWIIT